MKKDETDRKPEITDLSDVPVTEVEITKPQIDVAIASLRHADKSARYAMVKGAGRRIYKQGTGG